MQKKKIFILTIALLVVFVLAGCGKNDQAKTNSKTDNNNAEEITGASGEIVLNEETGEYESSGNNNFSQSEQINNDVSRRSLSNEREEKEIEKAEEDYSKYVYPYFEESSRQTGMQTSATGKWEKEKGFQLLARILSYKEGEELIYSVGYLDDKGEWNGMKRFESAKENIYNLDAQFRYPGYLDKLAYSSKGISVGGDPVKFLESKISFVSGNSSIVSTIDHTKAVLISDIPIVPIKEWAVCGDVINYAEQIYNTVQIGSQCWFKENLNVGARLCSNEDLSNRCATNQGVTCESIDKYCYCNLELSCDSSGALYQWDKAMCGSVIEGAQGICPDGWHIPTDTEFKILEMELGMTQKQADACSRRSNGVDAKQVVKLRPGGSSGFDAVFTGHRKDISGTDIVGLFEGKRSAYFWSSSEDGNDAWSRSLSQDLELDRYPVNKLSGYAVRCLKD